jgi:hypothetical protein
LQPSEQCLSSLNAADISRIQPALLEVICSGQPGSDDPETVLARVKQRLKSQVDDVRACELLSRLDTLLAEAMELVLHDIEHERLSPEEKRRLTAQKATYYRRRQIERMRSP